MKTYRYAIAALVLCVVSPLFAAKAPGWLSGQSEKYPSGQYLVGVGLGTDLDAARSNARAEIAKVFQTRIVQSSQDISKERSGEGATAGFAAENSNELTTRTTTDDVLQGAEIAETYLDPKKKLYYALAVLDKKKMRQSLAHEITAQEEIIASQAALAKNAAAPLEEIRALTKALAAGKAKNALLVRQRVVDPVTVPDMPDSVSTAQLQKQRDDAMKHVLFILEGEGENLLGMLGERITGAGFNVTRSTAVTGPTTVIAVRPAISVNPVDRNNPSWKFYDWNATLEIKDLSDNGKIIAAVARQGQASHVSEGAARDKAMTDAAQALAVALEQQIGQYFFGK